jgi:hypothetical protein
MKTPTLLAATLLSFFVAGQTAMAGEGAERDEYSIGVVWNTDFTDADRVNYSVERTEAEALALDKELFPESEGR